MMVDFYPSDAVLPCIDDFREAWDNAVRKTVENAVIPADAFAHLENERRLQTTGRRNPAFEKRTFGRVQDTGR